MHVAQSLCVRTGFCLLVYPGKHLIIFTGAFELCAKRAIGKESLDKHDTATCTFTVVHCREGSVARAQEDVDCSDVSHMEW